MFESLPPIELDLSGIGGSCPQKLTKLASILQSSDDIADLRSIIRKKIKVKPGIIR
jgi:hypothetical protein